MLISAFNQANDKQRAELESWIGKTDFDAEEKITAVTKLYNEMGIGQVAKEKMDYYYEQSKKYLAAISLPEERKSELKAYAAMMMKRQK